MKIEPKQIKVREIFESFADNGDDGVFAYGGRLAVRPPSSPRALPRKSPADKDIADYAAAGVAEGLYMAVRVQQHLVYGLECLAAYSVNLTGFDRLKLCFAAGDEKVVHLVIEKFRPVCHCNPLLLSFAERMYNKGLSDNCLLVVFRVRKAPCQRGFPFLLEA